MPTDAEFVRVFEKTLIGGFSCVITRLVFDTSILLNDSEKEKLLAELNIDRKKQLKTVKVLKMDENNHYGQAMTKPLPYGCMKKEDKVPPLTEFNKILYCISHDDKIGHLFTVDIKFHNVNEKTLLFNAI